MSRRFETNYRLKSGDNLGDPEFWNRRFEDLDRRVDSNETALDSVDAVADRIEATALQRLDLQITPLVVQTRERLRSLADIFVSSSVSKNTISKTTQAFTVPESDRLTFATLGYVIADAVGGEAGMGGPVQSFDTETGTLVLSIDYTWGAGSFSAWILTGSPPINAIVAAADPVIADRVSVIGDAIAADAVTRIATAQAQVQAVADSRLPLDGTRKMTGNLEVFANYAGIKLTQNNGAYLNHSWFATISGADGTLFLQKQKNGAFFSNPVQFKEDGKIVTAELGDLRTYVDQAVRSDFNQGLSRVKMQQARRNMGLRTGRRYFTGNGGVANITAADIGGLIYLEADINTCNFIGVNAAVDGDFAEVYCRGNVRFNSAGTDAYGFGFGDTNLSFFDAKAGDRLTLSMGADAWDVVGYSTRHNKALMADRALILSDTEKQQLYTNADLALPFCGGRLQFDATYQISLRPYASNKIFINGNYRTIPAGGVIASNAGLTANTLYYVFAYWDVGAQQVKLAIGIGAPKTDPLYGHQVANSQATDALNRLYTLVGMVYMNGSANFQSDNAARWVASYYHRQQMPVFSVIYNNAFTNSGAWVTGGNTLYALNWADSAVDAFHNTFAVGNGAGAQGQSRMLLDGATPLGQQSISTFYAISAYHTEPTRWMANLPVGMHTFTVQVLGNGGGAYFYTDLTVQTWV